MHILFLHPHQCIVSEIYQPPIAWIKERNCHKFKIIRSITQCAKLLGKRKHFGQKIVIWVCTLEYSQSISLAHSKQVTTKVLDTEWLFNSTHWVIAVSCGNLNMSCNSNERINTNVRRCQSYRYKQTASAWEHYRWSLI